MYGIEKDYRLVKTAKVSCFLNGDGLARIFNADGLANFETDPDYKGLLKEISKSDSRDNQQFEVLIANPPYSVSAFKNTLVNGEKSFDLYSRLTDNSSEIECLFIERTKQLMADGGYVGIILPSSILSNAGIYEDAREILFKYFRIVAIVEFSSNTFMATGTNTVTLFLEKRNNNEWLKIQHIVKTFFTNGVDIACNGIENPFSQYVGQVYKTISLVDYVTLIKRCPNDAVKGCDVYRDYHKWFNELTIVKNRKEQRAFKALSAQDQQADLDKMFFDEVLIKEAEKLLYFILALPQKIVVVKSNPDGKNETEKAFLGYEFSNRRGHEGIKPYGGRSVQEATKLYDEALQLNPAKVNAYIYNSFLKNEITVEESLQNHVSIQDLVELMAFNRVEFGKSISLAVKKKVVEIKSKWPVKSLSEIVEIIGGGTPDTTQPHYWNGKIPWLSIADFNNGERFVYQTEKFITENGLKNSSTKLLNIGDLIVSARGTVGALAQLKQPMAFNQSCYGLRGKKDIDNGFLYFILKQEIEQLKNNSYGAIFSTITTRTFQSIFIPIPPIDVQQKIVEEIEQIEKEIIDIKSQIIAYPAIINKHLISIEKTTKQIELRNICNIKGGKRVPLGQSFINEKTDYPYLRVVDFKDFSIDKQNLKYIGEETFKQISNYTISKDDVYISIAGTIGLVGIVPDAFDNKSLTENAAKIIIQDKAQLDKYYLMYSLASDFVQKQIADRIKSLSVPKLALNRIETIQIQLPDINTQKSIVAEINKERKLVEERLNTLKEKESTQKAILSKYLQ